VHDPHVETLVYRVVHSDDLDYSKAKPETWDDDVRFRIVLVKPDSGTGRAIVRFEMKEHHATEDAARTVVEPTARAWSLSALLKDGPGAFDLEYDHTELIDRAPSKGRSLNLSAGIYAVTGMDAQLTIGRKAYPSPPADLAVNPDIQMMAYRYTNYREDREPLAGMANFCRTVFLMSANGQESRVAKSHKIEREVLAALTILSTERGGRDARKAEGRDQEHSRAERQWVEEVILALIRRAAEYEYDPNGSFHTIRMSDFPDISASVSSRRR